MSNQNAKGKPKYESPILVPLGEMAKGSGDCVAGLSDVVDCTAGTAALNNCSQGVSALVACTAGLSAAAACTAGGKNVGS